MHFGGEVSYCVTCACLASILLKCCKGFAGYNLHSVSLFVVWKLQFTKICVRASLFLWLKEKFWLPKSWEKSLVGVY